MKIGVDLMKISNFEKMKSNDFMNKVFQNSELKNHDKLHSIFVIKEAVMKALGGKKEWKLIEVNYLDSGKPFVKLDSSLGNYDVECSVSHDGDYVIGFVILNDKK